MNLQEAIVLRRSVRDYEDKTVDEAVLRELLEAAVQAPSAMNSQPWAFGIISGKEVLQQLSDEAKLLLLQQMERVPDMKKYEAAFHNPKFNIFYNASTLIVIYAKPEGPCPAEDCCLAAQNLMLAARDKELGTCWIGFAMPCLNTPEYQERLHIPAGYKAVAPIVIGYPKREMGRMEKKAPELLYWHK